jgi:quinol monooxygenase YgiN
MGPRLQLHHSSILKNLFFHYLYRVRTNSRSQADCQTQWEKLVITEVWRELAAGEEQVESSSVKTRADTTKSKNIFE